MRRRHPKCSCSFDADLAALLLLLPLQNAMRDLPPCWHMVGPLVVDRDSADFPPKFGPEDAGVEAFLHEAAGEPLLL